MNKMPSIALSILSGILLYSGCSVKELRESCPCRLVLDFNKVDTSVIKSAELYVTVPDGFVFTDDIGHESFRNDYQIDVPRTGLYLNLVNGAGGCVSETGLDIALGEECPPVYMHSSFINADCELWREIIRLRKNHCRMNITVKGDEGYMPRLTVISDVSGYDVEGKPITGMFEREVQPDHYGKCSVIVPRQIDDGMVLDIDDGKGVLKRFALGTYIASIGYDWASPDLQDLNIELDFAVTGISIQVLEWDKEYVFDTVI